MLLQNELRAGTLAKASKARGDGDHKGTIMSRLETATRRLEQALERLEAAVTSGSGAQGEDSEVWREALQRAQADYAVLEQRSDEVSARLDDAIGRLRGLLED